MLRATLAMVLALLPPFTGAAEELKVGQVVFSPCEVEPRQGLRYRAHCTEFRVPESRAEPDARMIALRVVLVAAESRRPLPDPIVFLAGGPGQSAVDAWPLVRKAVEPLTRRRHVLLVDQRGTGGSNPLHCPVPDWKAELEASLDAAREQTRECLRQLAGKADTRFYTTSDYIQDLEDVRQAMGIAQFNVMGGSYGTRVALEYLRRHPQSIRSVFIDSVVPPELALLQDHAVNLESTLDAISRRCLADGECKKRFGGVQDTLRSLSTDLRDNPRRVTIADPTTNQKIEVPFNDATLLWVVRFFSYSPGTSSLLPLLLNDAAAGRPEALLAQAEMIARSLPEELAHGMELSVVCAEDADLLREREQDRTTLMGVEPLAYLKAQCEIWPHGTRPADFKEPVVSDKPVLLLSGEYDPVTPPRYAEQVAKTLSRSRHLFAKGQGHTPMGVGCMPRLLQRFVDTLDPQNLDAGCLDVLGDTPFFLGYEGPAP